MRENYASPDYSPRPDNHAVHARDPLTLDDLPTLVKAVLASPTLDTHLAEIDLDAVPGRVRAGVFKHQDGTYREVAVIVVQATSTRDPAEDVSTRFGLTRRETEVALLLAKRLSAKEIARELGFTRFTADRHTEHVLGKLGVTSRRDVAPVLANFVPAFG